MADIRTMRERDLDAVRDVDSEAFSAWAEEVYGDAAGRFRRTRDNVQACLQRDPEGCFVATENERVVGFIFSRTWGGVGWFGTFAVLPECQRQGVGKRLISASFTYLRQQPGRLIGLETMAESPYNLGLYLRMGFEVVWPTLVLTRSIPPDPQNRGDVRPWSAAGAATQQRWLSELRVATARIIPGLDYAKEVAIHEAFQHGETLVLCNGARAVGLSVVRLVSGVERGDNSEAKVQVLAIDPQDTDEDRLGALVGATEALAAAAGKRTLSLPVSGQHSWTVQQLLQRGYQVERMAVRMLLPDTGHGLHLENAVDCSRWAG